MYLQKIHIENYRLLQNVDIMLDPTLTLIVGKNNTGKTSVANLIKKVLNEEKTISIDDYPLECRAHLYETVENYWSGLIKEEEIKHRIAETRISFYIDYSEESDDQPLGGLAPFIIDIDENSTVARIDAVYAFNALETGELFTRCKDRYDQLLRTRQEDVPQEEKADCYERVLTTAVVKEYFEKFFLLKVLAINPNNDNDYQEKPLIALSRLFTYRSIEAERNLDESESKNERPLAGIMSRVFNPTEENITKALAPVIEELNQYVDDVNFTVQEKVNALMDQIIEGMVHFGYPSAEDMQLKANSGISLKQQILSNTDLTYISANKKESLPSTHNGLGYKNLIKMALILTDFSKAVISDLTTIPLLLIEEPEAHMHPQLQTTFVSFLNKFFEESIGTKRRLQIILSSHSSHVANTVDFRQVRYMRRTMDGISCKDLQLFYQIGQGDERKENFEFLQKYLKLSYCDLYFCDKAILVEGAAERLLIPKMIEKCAKSGAFDGTMPPLQSQYYALVEVGGAYAHRFYDFLDFLEIPTLILTDVDYVGEHNKKCQKSDALHSSNGAINRWCRDAFGIPVSKSIPIDKVIELSEDSAKRTNGLRHIEFQKKEHGTYPRSLEESIQNVNRKLFGIDENATEIKLFDDNCEGEKKTDFAIKLLTDPQYDDFQIPSYIRDGLVWLNNQLKIPTQETPIRQHKQLRKA